MALKMLKAIPPFTADGTSNGTTETIEGIEAVWQEVSIPVHELGDITAEVTAGLAKMTAAGTEGNYYEAASGAATNGNNSTAEGVMVTVAGWGYTNNPNSDLNSQPSSFIAGLVSVPSFMTACSSHVVSPYSEYGTNGFDVYIEGTQNQYSQGSKATGFDENAAAVAGGMGIFVYSRNTTEGNAGLPDAAFVDGKNSSWNVNSGTNVPFRLWGNYEIGAGHIYDSNNMYFLDASGQYRQLYATKDKKGIYGFSRHPASFTGLFTMADRCPAVFSQYTDDQNNTVHPLSVAGSNDFTSNALSWTSLESVLNFGGGGYYFANSQIGTQDCDTDDVDINPYYVTPTNQYITQPPRDIKLVGFTYNGVHYVGYMTAVQKTGLTCNYYGDIMSRYFEGFTIVGCLDEYWGGSYSDDDEEDDEPHSGESSDVDGGNGTYSYPDDSDTRDDADSIGGQTTGAVYSLDYNSAGIHMYILNTSQITSLWNDLWATDGNGELQIGKLFKYYQYNPFSCIIKLIMLPDECMPVNDALTYIRAAGITLNTQGRALSASNTGSTKTVHVGSVNITKVFDNFAEFEKVQVRLHLPFCGDVMIDPRFCAMGSISVDYVVDFSNGNLMAYVFCTDWEGITQCIYTASGNCAVPQYLMGSNLNMKDVTNGISQWGQGLANIGGGFLGGGMKQAGSGMGGLLGGINNLLTSRMESGYKDVGGSFASVSDPVCWIEITRGFASNPLYFNELMGAKHGIGHDNMNDLKGFYVASYIDTSDIGETDLGGGYITDEEREEISAALKEGILL